MSHATFYTITVISGTMSEWNKKQKHNVVHTERYNSCFLTDTYVSSLFPLKYY